MGGLLDHDHLREVLVPLEPSLKIADVVENCICVQAREVRGGPNQHTSRVCRNDLLTFQASFVANLFPLVCLVLFEFISRFN